MNLQDLKTEVNYINQNSTRKSFEILIELLEKTGFASALTLVDDELAKTMADTPADQPKVEQEDKDAQMQDGEEIPDADIVEQSEIDPAKYPQDEQEDPTLQVGYVPGDEQEDKEPATGDQTMDAQPTTGDAPEKMSITSDDVGELPAEVLEDQKTVMGVTDEGTIAHYKDADINKEN